MLNHEVSIQQCIEMTQNGINKGMIKRLHRHILVKQPSQFEINKKITQSGLQNCDELCVMLGKTEM